MGIARLDASSFQGRDRCTWVAVFYRPTTLIGIAALSLLMLETRDAPAHPNVAAALPNDGSILDEVPERVVLRFTNKITSRYTKIELKGPHGSSSLSYQGTGGEPTRELSIPVPDQGNGSYSVKWEIVSTDGDHLGGKLRFSVKPKVSANE